MMRKKMRFSEFEKPYTLQQMQDKSLKQQARRIQIQQAQRRLQKQREKAAASAAQLAKLQNKSP